jgi:hypothetical protein
MQANKSREEIEHFDLFECLSCRTTIRESKPGAGDKNGR